MSDVPEIPDIEPRIGKGGFKVIWKIIVPLIWNKSPLWLKIWLFNLILAVSFGWIPFLIAGDILGVIIIIIGAMVAGIPNILIMTKKGGKYSETMTRWYNPPHLIGFIPILIYMVYNSFFGLYSLNEGQFSNLFPWSIWIMITHIIGSIFDILETIRLIQGNPFDENFHPDLALKYNKTRK